MADIDTGGGNAVNAAWITERLIAMGLAGMNIEDQVFPKRCGHMAGKEVISAEEMAGKVRACAAVRDRLDKDFIINARTDVFAGMGLDEAIRRCNLYLEAGADLAFIDGIKTRADIEKAVKAVKGPLSVNLMDAISGMKTELIPIPELTKMGVGRVSIPVASIMVAHKALVDFFTGAQGLADRHPARPDAVGFVLRGVHRFRRAQGIPGHGERVPALRARRVQVQRRRKRSSGKRGRGERRDSAFLAAPGRSLPPRPGEALLASRSTAERPPDAGESGKLRYGASGGPSTAPRYRLTPASVFLS